jgi:hypothetical protein
VLYRGLAFDITGFASVPFVKSRTNVEEPMLKAGLLVLSTKTSNVNFVPEFIISKFVTVTVAVCAMTLLPVKAKHAKTSKRNFFISPPEDC